MKKELLKIVVWSLFLGIITAVVLNLGNLLNSRKKIYPIYSSLLETTTPPLSASPATWYRVDGDFKNQTCQDFCLARGKKCLTSSCPPGPSPCTCTGGTCEIETWNSNEGIVCDRSWDGQCAVPFDRYPPAFKIGRAHV